MTRTRADDWLSLAIGSAVWLVVVVFVVVPTLLWIRFKERT